MDDVKIEGLLDGEELRPLPDNPMYLVSNLGRVYSLQRRKANSKEVGWIDGSWVGALKWFNILYSIGEYKWRRKALHRMVAEVWVENPNGYDHTRFLDGNKRNVVATNMGWIKDRIDEREYVVRERSEEDSAATKMRRSRAKSGRAHPSFIGYFWIDGIRYESAAQAAKSVGTYAADVIRKCKGEKKEGWRFEAYPPEISLEEFNKKASAIQVKYGITSEEVSPSDRHSLINTNTSEETVESVQAAAERIIKWEDKIDGEREFNDVDPDQLRIELSDIEMVFKGPKLKDHVKDFEDIEDIEFKESTEDSYNGAPEKDLFDLL